MKHRQPKALPPVRQSICGSLADCVRWTLWAAVVVIGYVYFLSPLLAAIWGK